MRMRLAGRSQALRDVGRLSQTALLGLLGYAVVLGVAGPARTQQGDSQEREEPSRQAPRQFVDEIIVTAQKREQPVIEVPISIAVVDGETIELELRDEFSELQFLVSGVTVTEANTSSGHGSFIRGIGTQSHASGLEGSVGTVVDGVVLGRQGMAFQDLADIERVEVLRGPQGTLFGKNASAGVINIVTRPPDSERAGSFSASFASMSEVKLRGSVGGPLAGDRVSSRLSAYSYDRDGLIEDITLNRRYNGRNESGARGKLLVDASDRVSILVNADYARRDDPCCMWTTRSVNPDGFIAALQAPVVASPNNLRVSLSGDVYDRQSFGGLSTQVDALFGDTVLTSIGAYRTWHNEHNDDADQVPVNIFDVNSGENDRRQVSQEIRLSTTSGTRIEWTAGLFCFDLEQDGRTLQSGTLGAPLPAGVVFARQSVGTVDTLNLALFGDVTWTLSDRTTLFAGLRAIREEKDVDISHDDVPGQLRLPGTPPPLEIEAGTEDDAAAWRLGVQFEIGERSRGYAKIGRGYKGKGISTDRTGATLLEPEIPTTYEIGYKTQQRRFSLGAAVFSTEFDDFQAQSWRGEELRFGLANAGRLETDGLELDFMLQPSSRLHLSGNLTYMDAIFAEYVGAGCYATQTEAQGCDPVTGTQDLSGARLDNAPEWMGNVAVQYSAALGDLPFEGFVRGSYHWRDDVLFFSTDPGTRQGAFGLANLSLGIFSTSGHYQISVFAKNLFDQGFAGVIIPTPLDPGGYAQNPSVDAERVVGVAVELDF